MRFSRLLGVAACAPVLATGFATDAGAQTAAPCDPAIEPAVEFAGLPERVPIGKTETFGFQRTFATQLRAVGPYNVEMADQRNRVFFNGQAAHLRARFWIRLVFEERFNNVTFTYREIDDASGATCEREISQRVYAEQLILFPGRCTSGLRQRPRSVVVACGDGNLQLRRMRWRSWNRRVTRGRGTALINDCIPYCAEGSFHRVPIQVRLDKPKRCRFVQRYVYTRMTYRYLRRPSWLRSGSATVPWPCRLYDPDLPF